MHLLLNLVCESSIFFGLNFRVYDYVLSVSVFDLSRRGGKKNK